jgi:uracil-DNA glycosylase
MMIDSIDMRNYNYEKWSTDNYKFIFNICDKCESWKGFFESFDDNDNVCANIFDHMESQIKNGHNIFPYPELVFYFMELTNFNNVNVVIIGQDPYFKFESADIPQAMGLSFSVPNGANIPSSLRNIYKNLEKYKHINKSPDSGNVEKWANQGCFMMNTSLTVQENKKNSDAKYWSPFTDKLIKYISDNRNNVIFVLWGKHALQKLKLIDQTKHNIIISSHPSGLSCNRKMGIHKAFNDQDHFGLINTFLENNNAEKIKW